MRLKNMTAVAVLMTMGVLLTGCNNDSNSSSSSSQPAPSSEDAFIAQVRQQTDGANAMSDTAEPIDIMQINETSPEQSQPQDVTL